MTGYPELDPAWREWILDNADRGCAREAMFAAMSRGGWAESLAPILIEQVLLERDILASSTPVPAPALEDSPTVMVAGDRAVRVLLTLQSPRLILFGGLLTDEECAALIDAAGSRMADSTVIEAGSGSDVADHGRVSRGMFFRFSETPLVARIEERLATLCRWPRGHSDALQVLHYLPGGRYAAHYDYFAPGQPGTAKIMARGGQRVASIVMYLNTPEAGGSTNFPQVGLEVAAQRGNAVFFSYERPHPSTKTLHAGSPVIRGEKWIATLWFRERAFGSSP